MGTEVAAAFLDVANCNILPTLTGEVSTADAPAAL